MIIARFVIWLLFFSCPLFASPGRVQRAWENKHAIIQSYFRERGISFPPTELFLRVFKLEGILEVWARNAEGPFSKIKEYKLCERSGNLGPKHHEGDKQIPEGLYTISGFNPASLYHLSLQLNYPNEADMLRGGDKLGGEIYIHGGCMSVGCIDITDDSIDEVFLMAQETMIDTNNPIRVHIFPTRMTRLHREFLKRKFGTKRSLLTFWDTLTPIYEFFETHHLIPKTKVDLSGNYLLEQP